MNWRLSAHTQLRFIALIFDCESFSLFSPSTHTLFVCTHHLPIVDVMSGWLKMWFHWRYRRHSIEKAETTQTSDITHHIHMWVGSRGERMLIDISRVSIGFSFLCVGWFEVIRDVIGELKYKKQFQRDKRYFHFKANSSLTNRLSTLPSLFTCVVLLFRNHLRSSAAIGIGEILNSALEFISETQQSSAFNFKL